MPVTAPRTLIEIENFIGGEFRPALSEKWLDNYNPARGEVYSRLPDSGSEDVKLAIDAASKAFPAWSQKSRSERAAYLVKIAEKILERSEELALAESVDTGKPLSLARSLDIPRAAQNFSYFAEALLAFKGEKFEDNNALNVTDFSPLGVVSCISPWNLPLYLFSWKIAPALAMGNCVVGKPSEVTPMTAYLLSRIAVEIGLPPGVLNIVHGSGAKLGSELVKNKKIKAVSFTGSTRVGSEISQMAAPLFKKLSLEMGGKNATVVFADCDFAEAVRMSVRSAFLNQGQICLCGSRMLIEKSIYEKFKNAFVAATLKLQQGDPMAEGTDQGAVVSKIHFDKVMACIETAEDEGGVILTGGTSISMVGEHKNGWFIAPTLVEGLDQNCKTNQEEIFGPVVTLQSFDSEEEAIEMANATRYGLASSVWTEDLVKADRVARKLEMGIAWINCWMLRDLRTPFGGVKESGMGREGGDYALKFFSEAKNICTKIQ